MSTDTDTIKAQLYDFLVAQNMRPKRYDSKWNLVQDSNKADVFQFHFHKDGEDYGTVSIMIDGSKALVVMYPSSVADSPNTSTNGGLSWIDFVKRLKRWGVINHQLGFKLEDEGDLEDRMARREQEKHGLNEGYYGTRHTSYTDKQPGTIKIVFKHSKPMQEGDQRFRNIEKIFLENEHGERILAPTTKPSVGRAFARCLAEGDEVNGSQWKHIAEMADEVSKLGGFLRATRNKQVNESVGKLITEAQAYYESLRTNIKHLQSTRGYNNYFESWKPQLNETEEGTSVLEMFRNNSVDPRIEGALPILNRLNKNVMEMSEINTFESWADSIVSETLKPSTRSKEEDLYDLIGPDSELLNVGPNAENVIPQLQDIIEDETLYVRLQKAAKANPDTDARPIIIAWMSEHANDGAYAKVLDKIKNGEAEEPKQAEQPKPAPAPKPQPKPQPQPQQEPKDELPVPPLEEELDKDDDLWDLGKHQQEFDSAKTSINKGKLPATFGTVDKKKMFDPKGKIIADIGGGKFDNAVEWAQERNGQLHVYDPFNRSAEHNKEVIGQVAGGKADIATCNNVLNVIKEPEARARVIKQAANVLKPGGNAYFLIYEGDKSGEGKDKGNGRWQNNLPTRAYIDEISQYFDDVQIKHGLIVATKGASMEEGKTMKDRRDIPSSTPRNFVAKNSQSTGAGKHKHQGEYQRKEKHPHRELRKVEVTESPLAKLKRLSGL